MAEDNDYQGHNSEPSSRLNIFIETGRTPTTLYVCAEF